jgi:hypothetical protein
MVQQDEDCGTMERSEVISLIKSESTVSASTTSSSSHHGAPGFVFGGREGDDDI